MDKRYHDDAHRAEPLRPSRDLAGGLRDLDAVEAPPTLLGGVLAEVGLADGYWRVESAIGLLLIAYNAAGISAVRRGADAGAFEEWFRARFGRALHPVARPPRRLAEAVEDALRTGRARRLRFDLRGLSEFERKVLEKALEIPPGEVRPYGWVAREIGRPGAVRAVGSALGNNPVPLLIPCHRVVRSDGSLGGYVFGGEVKRAVLEAEGVRADLLEDLARRGVRYYGSDTTHVYCFPTCRHARRVTDAHLVTFGSIEEANAAGYRPCKTCRPPLAS